MKPPLKIDLTRASSVERAREMRKNPTDAEQRLWWYLRDRRANHFKFRRQHPIGPFIVDFCCIEKKLVIELDGEQHLNAQEYDTRRSEALGKQGFRVIRSWNGAVLTDIQGVLEVLSEELEK